MKTKGERKQQSIGVHGYLFAYYIYRTQYPAVGVFFICSVIFGQIDANGLVVSAESPPPFLWGPTTNMVFALPLLMADICSMKHVRDGPRYTYKSYIYLETANIHSQTFSQYFPWKTIEWRTCFPFASGAIGRRGSITYIASRSNSIQHLLLVWIVHQR